MTNMLDVIYADTKLEVPANTDMKALEAAMIENFPELKNPTITREGNTITFTAKAGTKGADNMEMLDVVYADTKLEVPANTDMKALEAAMIENFPELKNPTITREGNTVTFTAKAGTKGSDMLDVIYADTKLEVPADTDMKALEAAMIENFPELKNPTVTREGNTITFTAKAGTKGSDMLEVIYADTKLDVPADTDMKALEAAMIENFPELKNPTITREGNVVTFTAKAGTKGNVVPFVRKFAIGLAKVA
ncbi:hypothetical protein P4493_10500 [Bacillus thuringiensis]|jgi:hypothetical protein|uniref:Uncharacterized protein n=3 Tax=Bacillus thuringiensis TaxID=1428 RepID=A0AB35P9W7_BACTU|nr:MULTISPECIES: hypothetical protein [Bacillus]AFQ30307.1 hypothetical protein BTF1_31032 [Bacillus thuringiensis HD-789]AJH02418.1 membrane-associated tegument family protein [Bacillus thuringiensis HD1002]AND28498.1 hypothetical protein ATN07_32740 [Bacillus thuringiensis serovar israelensis]EEM99342.1 hypothetical protein bthur0014_58480 [Bacillus thuringiensis IBL 4222]EXL36819.1 hypothetical protein BG78_23775 [Bacillus thuringiensis serovar israelensis]